MDVVKDVLWWVEDNWGYLVIGGLLLLLIFLIVGVVDYYANYEVIDTQIGEVVDLQYSPSKHSSGTGVGYGVGGDGNVAVGVVTTSHTENEKWTVIVNRGGEIESYSVSAAEYYNIKIGDHVKVEQRRGKLIGFKGWNISAPGQEPR